MKRIASIIVLTLIVLCVNAQELRPHRGRVQRVVNTASYDASSGQPTDITLDSKDANIDGDNRRSRVGSLSGALVSNVGSCIIPVILVQFQDLKFSVEADDESVRDNYDKYFNATNQPKCHGLTSGSAYGSVADYFISQSDSAFQPSFDVIGPVTLSNVYAYYGKNNGSSHDVNIGSLYSESCRMAMLEHNVSWTKYDNRNRGRVDFVIFVYAGYGENNSNIDDPNTIWPKSQSSDMRVTVDGSTVVFGGFVCSNELYDGEQDGIGTFVHELSHALGLPDFYDTANDNVYGMDALSIMDSGCYNVGGKLPCQMTAYELEFLHWRNTEALEYDQHHRLIILPSTQKDAVAYKVINPNDRNEYFILENRQNLPDTYDQYLGCRDFADIRDYGTTHGLMISHVHYSDQVWTSNKVNVATDHQRMTIVPADGTLLSCSQGLTSSYFTSLQSDLFPGPSDIHDIDSFETYAQGDFKMHIHDIHEDTTSGIITLDLYLGSATDEYTSIVNNHTVATSYRHQSIYDMTGRNITRPTSAGLYIIDGKKTYLRP